MTFIFVSPVSAQESKIKSALALRTHAQKILEADLHLENAVESLSLAREMLANGQWEIVGGYLEEARGELKAFAAVFPSCAAREKLRQSLSLYHQKKFAQSAALLEQLSEEFRWLGYYNDEAELLKQIGQTQQHLIRQKTAEFEKGIVGLIEKSSIPAVDGGLAGIESEILIALAGWNRGEAAAALARLESAESALSRFSVTVDLAQARHYVSRSTKLGQNRLKEKEARRVLKKAVQRLSKCVEENPDNAAVQRCFADAQNARRGWKENQIQPREKLESLLVEMDRLVASGGEDAGSR